MIKAALDKMFIPINDHRPKPHLKEDKIKAPKSVLFNILNLVNEKLNMLQRTRAAYRGDADSHHSSSSSSDSSPSEDEKHDESDKTKPKKGEFLGPDNTTNQQRSGPPEQRSQGRSQGDSSDMPVFMQRSSVSQYLNFIDESGLQPTIENYKNEDDKNRIREYIRGILRRGRDNGFNERNFKTWLNNYADYMIDEKVTGRGILSKKMTLKRLFKEETGKAAKKPKKGEKKK